MSEKPRVIWTGEYGGYEQRVVAGVALSISYQVEYRGYDAMGEKCWRPATEATTRHVLYQALTETLQQLEKLQRRYTEAAFPGGEERD